jgi:signal transduction histidine kinase
VERSLQRLNRLYDVLSETNQAIVRASERDTLFRDICRIAVDHGGFLLSWVGLVEETSGLMRISAAHGAAAYLDDIRISVNQEPAGSGPTGIVLREGTNFICNDFKNDPCTGPWQERAQAHGIQASAAITLKQEGQVIGAFTVYAGERDFFDQQHEALLQQMGADISFALDNLAREASRQETEEALHQATAERLQSLEDLREKDFMLLQQSRLAAMGEMIGNIAHQWRQPLNTLGLTIQDLALSWELGEFCEELLQARVAKAMQVISHMSRTIDDFRNFFRPDKQKEPFKVSRVIGNALSLIGGSYKNLQIRVEVDTGSDPTITGYPNEFAQVLLNILNNARDALVARGQGEPAITIALHEAVGRTVVTIRDNAGGIPEKILDKIFDPYFSTKGPEQGTGLGLFMAKTIIETNMGGTLTVRNAGDGAEFRIEV